MAVSTIQREEAFHSRRSDVYGKVELFAPKTSPQFWDVLPWELRTEKDEGGNPPGLRWLINSEYVMEAFNRPHLITPKMQYEQAVSTSQQ